MRGYLNAPEATAAAIDADGWLHTGDLGSMDDRGYLRIAGRLKEMIIRGGENIYPREIEEVLIGHPAVADASVLGVPDDYYGEVVGAAIRPADASLPGDGLAAELEQYCRARLAAGKVPVRWLVTGSFPLTPSGKIRKDSLRAQLDAPERMSRERKPGPSLPLAFPVSGRRSASRGAPGARPGPGWSPRR